MTISHKIELIPNNKAKTHFKKAFGCSRLAYNWGLAKWQEYYKQGIKKSHLELKKEFNAIKKEQFPFVYEVSKYATQQPFLNLNFAFQAFFRDLKKAKVSYPKFKKKRESFGSYYIGGDQVSFKKEKYLKVPNLGLVKMREKLRFEGKINSVTISQKANKFFASFSVEINEENFHKTYEKVLNTNNCLGIDVGLKSFISLSNGLQIKAPKPLNKLNRLLVKRARQLSKKQHAKTKQEILQGIKKSNNYKKTSIKLNKLHSKISNIRADFLHKLSSLIIRNFNYIGLEDLNIKGMLKNHHLAKAISDVSFYEFKRMLSYKSQYHKRKIIEAPRFYPSSKTCSSCKSIKEDLKLKDRIYHCKKCGLSIDRDYNASLNLKYFAQEKIGLVQAEFTPEDLTALLKDLAINNLITSKVETGIQQKSHL
ncbi:TPA: transposase [Campylobacter jejuni]|uniref:RNA-guided endonuclease InsQ/TnpB family protein n=1 Tax=Campylobacter jejuni TaxID=197 RepID=UPI0010593DE8|nr:RNA-guided endonuclease TnpB family protein [Campylobacter jejuni]EKK0827736.1 transposase [Campylobacter jejuni]EKK0827940.1 transposase [Campylobacter jejuni]EKS9092439.1 transposase [Campylobacter jejuni]MCW1321223.1 transposase [Campylobacter jejuni]MCW1347253.1 transposase [Campylobacter jejuni]